MFSDIIGNDKLKKELIHSVEINKTSHSYLFIGTEGIGKKLIAEEFAKMLLEEEKVAVIPGAAFGLENFIRLSYATSMEVIEEGLDRIKSFLGKLK